MSKAEGGHLPLTAVQLYAVTLHLHIPMRLLLEDSKPPPVRHEIETRRGLDQI